MLPSFSCDDDDDSDIFIEKASFAVHKDEEKDEMLNNGCDRPTNAFGTDIH